MKGKTPQLIESILSAHGAFSIEQRLIDLGYMKSDIPTGGNDRRQYFALLNQERMLTDQG